MDDGKRCCFIMGAPRSGTTWVWGLLSSHPDVHTITGNELGTIKELTSETGLFLKQKEQNKNISLFEEKLKKLNSKEILIEKTPKHTLFYKKILQLYPKTTIIYIDRNCRSIINSMMQTSFIKNTNTVEKCIIKLKPYIKIKEEILELENTFCIQYELLLKDTFAEVKKLLNHLKLNDNNEIIQQMIKENYQQSKIERVDVYRKGERDSWKWEMNSDDVKIVNQSVKLNILIANYEMVNFFGGTQTWTMVMKKALSELGHCVDIVGLKKGYNVHFKDHIKPLKKYYDILIANGNKTLSFFADKADIKIFVSHGILPKLEQPVLGADIYLAVSEEVADNLKRLGFDCKGILRNPIDLHKFTSAITTNKKLKNIAFFCRRRVFPFIKEIEKDFNVIQVGHPPIYNTQQALLGSDLVVALGRSVYESMALGKNVVVSGNNSGRSGVVEMMDGFVTPDRFLEYRKNNCSGRYNSIEVTCYKQFKEELDFYHEKYSVINRELIAEYNDANKIAKQLLNII